MITVGKLKDLLKNLPDNAILHAYEGEDVGIAISLNDKEWWIRCSAKAQDVYTEGFNEKS